MFEEEVKLRKRIVPSYECRTPCEDKANCTTCGHMKLYYDEVVCLTIEEYRELLHNDRILNALENGGVDNWSYYSEALHEGYPEMFEEENNATKM